MKKSAGAGPLDDVDDDDDDDDDEEEKASCSDERLTTERKSTDSDCNRGQISARMVGN